MSLSILIPYTKDRVKTLNELTKELTKQARKGNYDIQILRDPREKETIGEKRNWLLQKASKDYLCFIDSDDSVSQNYLDKVFEGINKGVDCCSLRGVITWDGSRPEIFEHSIKYGAYQTTNNDIKYERYPNHLNVIKSSIAKQFKFPEINHGEDTDFATQIFNSGLIKTEHYIDQVIYFYKYVTNK